MSDRTYAQLRGAAQAYSIIRQLSKCVVESAGTELLSATIQTDTTQAAKVLSDQLNTVYCRTLELNRTIETLTSVTAGGTTVSQAVRIQETRSDKVQLYHDINVLLNCAELILSKTNWTVTTLLQVENSETNLKLELNNIVQRAQQFLDVHYPALEAKEKRHYQCID